MVKISIRELILIKAERAKRLQRVLGYIREYGEATTRQLAEFFNISPQTVRRDLHKLEKMGLIIYSYNRSVPAIAPPSCILEHSNSLASPKDRIGRYAAEILDDNEIVFLGFGNTTLAVAHYLDMRLGLTIITCQTQHATLLRLQRKHLVWIMGGKVEHNTNIIIGQYAEELLFRLRVRTAIIGCDGLNFNKGITINTFEHYVLYRTASFYCNRLFVVVESSKLKNHATGFRIPINKIDVLITDNLAEEKSLQDLRDAGVDVRIT